MLLKRAFTWKTLSLILSKVIRVIVSHPGHDHDHLENLYEADKCFCCPWQMVLEDGCENSSNASFDGVRLIYHFRRGDDALKAYYEDMMQFRLSMVGVGRGMNVINNRCTQGKHSDWFAWSINLRTLPDVMLSSPRWDDYSLILSENLETSLGNETSPPDLNMILRGWKEVFRRFERFDDCGKKTADEERRCLHHVIDPLPYDNHTHHQSFKSLKGLRVVSDIFLGNH